MKHYLVITPQYQTSYSWDEPPEFGCDTCEVHAESEDDAKVLSLKLKDMRHWVKEAKSGDFNPLTGLKVQDMRCSHGFCWCSECTELTGIDVCEKCDKEADEHELRGSTEKVQEEGKTSPAEV